MARSKHRASCLGWLAFLALTLLSPALAASDGLSQRLDLGGRWQFQPVPITAAAKPAPGPSWTAIQVPDNWYRQGYDISGRAWYRKTFQLDTLQHASAHLVFAAVDYRADVWLNGQHLGQHEGYFQPFEFEVRRHLRTGQNELLVLVDSPLEQPADWSLNKRLIKGVLSHHDTRPGGAWSERGQEQNTGGIWGPVHLELDGEVSLRGITPLATRQDWGWQLHTALQLNVAGRAARDVEIEIVIDPVGFEARRYRYTTQRRIQAGEQTLPVRVAVQQPALWWPAGHGDPRLYRVQVRLHAQGRLIAQRATEVGFREVKVDPKTLQWQINGRRLFIRGTNYISTQWLAEMTPAAYQRDLQLMQQAHINAVRVHAHIEAPAFYAACDRLGMLVMQDFPLQWGYRDEAGFVREARRQAADMVHHFHRHPSIVSWTMHNEPPWDAPWMRDKYPNYRADQNRVLDQLLFEDVSRLDPTRVVRRESATDEHVWLGWYFGRWQDYAGKPLLPWVTEYGAQALPDLAALKRMFSDDELWPTTEQHWQKWSFHNFQPHETFNIAKVEKGNNIEQFIRNSQQHQARVIQYATESYRRQRYAPVSALFQFMFNEDWPSINWGVVDYWRTPKLGYQALKKAYQPVLPSIAWSSDRYVTGEAVKLGLWLINDSWQGYPQVDYHATLWRDGKRHHEQRWALAMPADSGTAVADLQFASLPAGAYQLRVTVSNAGRLLGDNSLDFAVQAPVRAASSSPSAGNKGAP
ncbi:glycoside hydrolase family 2 protein [Methylobacillus flagellatus]|uniref:glycoside hydrolase family 2 protein n=1 Tax=Methylobacillus flagellatus TaxID=405 RepID=UPI0010F6C0AA|nr:sugar-binding domain-containing protein [Methylobacillus flagellatus]